MAKGRIKEDPEISPIEQYTHPTGFTSQPNAPLANSEVISQIIVDNEGHITGIATKTLTSGLGNILYEHL